MAKSEKGKKGFQSLNLEDKKSVRISSYLTPKEALQLKDYCIKNNLKSSVLVRDFLLTLLD